ITLAMLAHAFLTALAAQAAHRETAETNRPASPPSPWRKSDGSWTLSCPTPDLNSTSVSMP
ncbi:IS701 family transposase, partial [Streptomyces sp. NPDC059802]